MPRTRSLLTACGALLLSLARAAGASPPAAPAAQPAQAVVTHDLAEAKTRAALGMMPFASPPTSNQLAFDVTAYDLDLAPNVAAQMLWGSARVRAHIVQSPVFSMELDLDDAMIVDSVKVSDTSCTFTHLTDLLTISFGRVYFVGDDVDLTVWYHGTPSSGAFGTVFAMQTRNGKPLVWTLSEPYGARVWWPCKDHPEDKADSVSVRVTVPSGMKTVSNGRRVEASDNGSVAITRWVEHHPIATYLVSIASYDYAVLSDWYRPAPTDSMEIVFYEFAEDTARSRTVNAEVKGMIAAYAARFGPYPFVDEKYGEAEFTWGGGMENQTITSLGNPASEYLVAHELAHSWWGDAVTCRDFHHIWLNEGFATYAPALWAEAQSGLPAYRSYLAGIKYFGAGTIYVPDDNDPVRIFDGNLSYDKGAWVLHMLRHVMGDTLFFQALRAYGAAHAYGTATTEDLRAACEAASGRDLGAFFDEWIYGEYYPQYGYRWESAAAGAGFDVTVELTQVQSWQLFWMPVDVRIQTAGGAQTFVAMDSLAAQSFVLHVDQAPLSVAIDPDEWILRTTGMLAVEPVAGAGLEFLPPRPNPSRGATSFAFVLPDPRASRVGARGEARLEIFDPRGALVRALDTGPLGAGPHVLTWDGRDRAGRPVAPGVYEARLTAGGAARMRRIVVVR
jgi:aminopeptidase N